MSIPAFLSPSLLELLIVAAIPAGIALIVWTLVTRQGASPASRTSRQGLFTEAIVDPDGILRAEVPLGPAWAGRPVRVVVEPIARI